MRMDKLTSRFQQALSDAQSLAVGRDHNLIEPAHLLLALLDQQGGGTRPLLAQAGVNVADLRLRLAEALDTYIPTPERAIDGTFLMPIEDVFSISGRGTVVTGRIERGVINVGDEVEIVGIRPTQKSVCTGVEMFRKLLDRG